MIASTHINGCVHISGIVSLALHLFIKFLFGVWCPIFFIMKLKFTHYLIFVHASEVFRLSKNLFFRIKFSSLPYLLKRVLIIHMPLIQINRGCDAHHSNHSGHNCIHDGHIVGLLRIHSRSDFWRLGLKIDVFRDFLGRLACNILSSVCSGIQWGGLVGSLIIWLGNVRRSLILLSLICRHRRISSVYWQRLIHYWACNIRHWSLILQGLILCLIIRGLSLVWRLRHICIIHRLINRLTNILSDITWLWHILSTIIGSWIWW